MGACCLVNNILHARFHTEGGKLGFPPQVSVFPPKNLRKFFIIIEKSVQIVNDDKYLLTFPRFVDASIDFPSQAKNRV